MKKSLLILSVVALFSGCSDNKKTLHVFSWADYIDPSITEEFEVKYNCHICIDTFDSNESAYSKLKAGASGYDICIPSSYMIKQMAKEGMIKKLDHSKLKTVDDNFDHIFDSQIIDPKLEYSIPYAVSYTGLMCLKDKIPNGDVSWDIFSETKLNQKLSLLEDIREVIGAGLMYNGYSLNSENSEEIEKATETILKWKKNIRKFDAESYKTEVANKSLYVGHAYSNDSLQIIIGDDENSGRDDIVFILPKEGFTIAWDEMVLMSGCENEELAYDFMNFIYEKENSYKNMVYNFSPVPNKKAIQELPEDLKKIIILDENTLQRGQVLKQFQKPETIDLYNKAWDRIKATK